MTIAVDLRRKATKQTKPPIALSSVYNINKLSEPRNQKPTSKSFIYLCIRYVNEMPVVTLNQCENRKEQFIASTQFSYTCVTSIYQNQNV